MTPVLDSFDFDANKRRRRGSKWDYLLDGRIHLIPRDDLPGDAKTLRVQLYRLAKTRGVKIRTSLTSDGLVVQKREDAE